METENKTPREIIAEVTSQKKAINHKDNLKQYDPKGHAIHDHTKRQDKVINTEKGSQLAPVARLSLSFQKLIVDRAAAFLVGDGIGLTASPDTDAERLIMDMIYRTWHDNKINYQTRQMARIWMSEQEVAELWYFDDKNIWSDMGFEGTRMRMQVLSHSLGDTLYPYFDEYGDMTAFGREFVSEEVRYFEVYLNDEIITYRKDTDWTEADRKENMLGKIPIVYYYRETTEWSDVQNLIERYETMISNFADANDYFASPMVKIKGKVDGFAEKGEQGKLITMGENADASYLTWDQAPEAIRLEKDTLQELIMAMTQTPDISFKQMQGIGNLSGIALKMMFLDAKLKTLKHQEEFGEGVQRRINLIRKGMTLVNTAVGVAANLQVEPEFRFYLPSNDQETINMLSTAAGNRAIMSRKTAVRVNPFVADPDQELEDIADEDAAQFGNIFPEEDV